MSRNPSAHNNFHGISMVPAAHARTSMNEVSRNQTSTNRRRKVEIQMETEARPASWKILLAFSMIYFVWGSTFLAIRVGVHEVPPFLLAAVRFFTAGLVMYAWLRLKGTPAPCRASGLRLPRSVRSSSSSITAACFGPNSASLRELRRWCWRPSRCSSRLMEIIFLRTQRLTVRLGLALLVGIVWRGGADEPFVFFRRSSDQSRGCDCLAGGFRHLVDRHDLYPPASASGVEADECGRPDAHRRSAAVRADGGDRRVSRASRRRRFRGSAWFALVYLIIAGSIVGFTAYVWLLHYESPTKVGTYAYVNPVVAVALGYFLGGEAIGPRTLAGNVAGVGERRHDYDDAKGG